MQKVQNIIENYNDRKSNLIESNISNTSPEVQKQVAENSDDKLVINAKDIVLKPFILNS